MTTQALLQSLVVKGILTEAHAGAIADFERNKTFSLHWELRTILYAGILLFTSGIGMLIYENIDTIGHHVVIGLIATLSAACFLYTYKHSLPYSNALVEAPKKLSGYVLLLGCTTFLVLEGYLQFQYEIFGTRYGLAVVIPAMIFFFCAYRFDHTGVLSMAITGLASWLGLTIAPLSVISRNDFTNEILLIAAIILGISLCIFGYLSDQKNIKSHFAFTYFFLGGNLACLAAITGLFTKKWSIVYFFVGIALSAFFVLRARQRHSLVFLLMGTIYGYVIITYALFSLLGDLAIALSVYYFLFSSAGVVFFLLNYKKFLKAK